MPGFGSLVSHVENSVGVHSGPESGASSSGHAFSTLPREPGTPSIVPGGGNAFALPSSSTALRKSAAHRKAAIDVTPVKLAGDTASYVIKDPSNTRTPQQLYIQLPNGNLKQTAKRVTYDGHAGVTRDAGLPGGVDDSKGARKLSVITAQTRFADAERDVGVTEQRIVTARQARNAAREEVSRANGQRMEASRDYRTARHRYDITLEVSGDSDSELAEFAAGELPGLNNERIAAKNRLDAADARLTSARGMLDRTEQALVNAKNAYRSALDDLDEARDVLAEVGRSSYG